MCANRWVVQLLEGIEECGVRSQLVADRGDSRSTRTGYVHTAHRTIICYDEDTDSPRRTKARTLDPKNLRDLRRALFRPLASRHLPHYLIRQRTTCLYDVMCQNLSTDRA